VRQRKARPRNRLPRRRRGHVPGALGTAVLGPPILDAVRSAALDNGSPDQDGQQDPRRPGEDHAPPLRVALCGPGRRPALEGRSGSGGGRLLCVCVAVGGQTRPREVCKERGCDAVMFLENMARESAKEAGTKQGRRAAANETTRDDLGNRLTKFHEKPPRIAAQPVVLECRRTTNPPPRTRTPPYSTLSPRAEAGTASPCM
jgi:hypothetical protein